LRNADSSWDATKKNRAYLHMSIAPTLCEDGAVASGDDLDPTQNPAFCDGRRLELASGIPNEEFLQRNTYVRRYGDGTRAQDLGTGFALEGPRSFWWCWSWGCS
jgi:hypothetical protein